MLADLFLQFSALCFCFISQDGKEIKEKEKGKQRRKKKEEGKKGVSQPMDQWLPVPASPCYVL
jgi:hypothetical protein